MDIQDEPKIPRLLARSQSNMNIRKSMGPFAKPIAHKLLGSIEICARECWNYTGQINNGYAWIRLNGSYIHGHRASFIIHKGHIPKGMFVMHSCDNGRCINPEHLSVGTEKQNRIDMYTKKRHAHGERVNTAKLSQSQVREIIRETRILKVPCVQVAKRYKVSRSAISAIKHGKTWRLHQ